MGGGSGEQMRDGSGDVDDDHDSQATLSIERSEEVRARPALEW